MSRSRAPGSRWTRAPGPGGLPLLRPQRAANRVRCGLDLGDLSGEGERALGILHAVPGENAYHPARVTQLAVTRALAQPRNRGRGRGLAEDSLAARDLSVGVEDLLVADGGDRASRFVTRGDRAFPRRGIADPDGGCDRLGSRDRRAADDRRGALRLVPVKHRLLARQAATRELDEAPPAARPCTRARRAPRRRRRKPRCSRSTRRAPCARPPRAPSPR